jgi:peptidyl-prolyl cis-trans isomerase B (cyclophilin B)
MLRPLVLIACLSCALLVAACGGDKKASATDESAATATATPAAPEGCKAASPAAKDEGTLPKPKAALDPSKTYVATVSTNCGDFEITLDSQQAPKTGGSFKSLADKGFYDGTTFHRIVSGFVIQGGDPKGDGSGGPGYSVVEAPPDNLAYTKGVVAMAKTQIEDPGTSGSQFFVVTGEDAQLPPEYALLGKVTEGQEVVDLIGVAPVGADEQPVDPIVIQKITIDEG